MINAMAFPIGIALMLVSINNVLLQRVLLVLNRAMLASKLLIIQSIFSILVLCVFQWRGASLIESVCVYFLIPILTFAPMALKIATKAMDHNKKSNINWRNILNNASGFWGLTALSSLFLGADYFFAARYLSDADMVSYHFSSRIFFISYVAYFSYVQFQAKIISAETLVAQPNHLWVVIKDAITIGILAVIMVLVGIIFIDSTGLLEIIGADRLVVIELILSAALYYTTRVFRDVGVVLIWNLGIQRLLYAVHMLEVVLALLLLNMLAPELGAKGIFFAMAIVSASSTIVIYIGLLQILKKITAKQSDN